MSAPGLVFLPLLILLTGAEALAQPLEDLDATMPVRRSVVLSRENSRGVPEIRIAPGILTTLLFEASLRLLDVEVEARERFSRAKALEDMLLLLPSSTMEEGQRLRLRLRFAEGTHPASADFLLVVDPSHPESQVEVSRAKEEVCWREAEAERTRAQQCQTELDRMRQQPPGLTGLLTAGLIDEKGISVRRLRRGEEFILRSDTLVKVMDALTYRSTGRVAVELWLTNATARPWMTVGAELVGEGEARLKGVRVWQQEPLVPGVEVKRVLVEADAGQDGARGRFTLLLQQEGDAALMRVEGVVFPEVRWAHEPGAGR